MGTLSCWRWVGAWVLATACGAAAAHALPEATLLDQDGRTVAFKRDLIGERTAIINFVFTSCTMICPTQAATMRDVQQRLGARVGRDIVLISVSIDPAVDVPARLKAFARRFDAGPGWHFLTGRKAQVDALLKGLESASASPAEHSGAVLVINDKGGVWTRLDDLPAAERIVQAVEQASAPDHRTKQGAARYFPDLPLLTQDGKPVRFYSDILKGKMVLLNVMFTKCPDICSPMTANLAQVQALLGERVGRDVYMVSISVDPDNDTPDTLKKFAQGFGIKPGWTFLTGKKDNVDWVRYKLGTYNGTDIGDHSTVLLAGNLQTGEWKKLMAMAPPAAIVAAIAPMLPGAP